MPHQAAISSSHTSHVVPTLLLAIVFASFYSLYDCIRFHNHLTTRRDSQMSKASISRFGGIGGYEPHGSEPWSRQTNDLNIDTCHFIIRIE